MAVRPKQPRQAQAAAKEALYGQTGEVPRQPNQQSQDNHVDSDWRSQVHITALNLNAVHASSSASKFKHLGDNVGSEHQEAIIYGRIMLSTPHERLEGPKTLQRVKLCLYDFQSQMHAQ